MNPHNLTGQIIIAPPSIPDRRFNNCVIYIASHTPAGAWGLALNKPIEHVSIGNIMKRLDYPVHLEGIVHAGGPMETTTVHFLHTDEVITDETIVDQNGICVSGTVAFMDQLARDNVPSNYRVFLGACSWAPGQLESEILGDGPWTAEHSWLIAPANKSIIFGFDDLEQWHAAVDSSARSAVKEWMC